MNKALLVALREYMENLKTKTFWIGIMVFPVILVIMFLVPGMLKKDVRKYAVIDNSENQWLSKAIEEKAACPDLERVFLFAINEHKKQSKEFGDLPASLQAMARKLSGVDGAVIQAMATLCSMAINPEGRAQLEKAALFIDYDKDKFDINMLEQDSKAIIDWWSALSPKEAKKFGSSLSKSKYQLVKVSVSETDPIADMNEYVKEGKIFAYFVIGPNPEEGNKEIKKEDNKEIKKEDDKEDDKEGKKEDDKEGKKEGDKVGDKEVERDYKYVSNNLTDTTLRSWFSNIASDIVRSKRIETAQIDEAVAMKIQEPLIFYPRRVSEAGVEAEVEVKDTARQWAPAVFVYILWISVITIAQMLLTNTIEEKSNKIMEVLLSSVSPIQLMAGKIIGIAGTGLTMVCSWIIFLLIGIKFLPLIMKQAPPFDLGVIVRDPIYLMSFVAYFIMGYLLLSAIIVGIGSVCNSLKEAQNLMAPITIILLVPLLAMIPIGEDPNGSIAKILSYIPPFTPFVMMNRAAGPPTVLEYVVTTLLLLVSIVIALWAAAKVFRVGILMTGKPPKIREIFRWIRAPVGHVSVRDDELPH